MRAFFPLYLILTTTFCVFSQKTIIPKKIEKKELRALKRQKAFEKQKTYYEKRGLNAWGINENAPNLVMAIREHLGTARIDPQRGLVIIRQSESFSNAQAYPLWIIDGQQYDFPPNGLVIQNIRKVKVYESLAETNKWGQQGRAGVIEIITLNLIN